MWFRVVLVLIASELWPSYGTSPSLQSTKHEEPGKNGKMSTKTPSTSDVNNFTDFDAIIKHADKWITSQQTAQIKGFFVKRNKPKNIGVATLTILKYLPCITQINKFFDYDEHGTSWNLELSTTNNLRALRTMQAIYVENLKEIEIVKKFAAKKVGMDLNNPQLEKVVELQWRLKLYVLTTFEKCSRLMEPGSSTLTKEQFKSIQAILQLFYYMLGIDLYQIMNREDSHRARMDTVKDFLLRGANFMLVHQGEEEFGPKRMQFALPSVEEFLKKEPLQVQTTEMARSNQNTGMLSQVISEIGFTSTEAAMLEMTLNQMFNQFSDSNSDFLESVHSQSENRVWEAHEATLNQIYEAFKIAEVALVAVAENFEDAKSSGQMTLLDRAFGNEEILHHMHHNVKKVEVNYSQQKTIRMEEKVKKYKSDIKERLAKGHGGASLEEITNDMRNCKEAVVGDQRDITNYIDSITALTKKLRSYIEHERSRAFWIGLHDVIHFWRREIKRTSETFEPQHHDFQSLNMSIFVQLYLLQGQFSGRLTKFSVAALLIVALYDMIRAWICIYARPLQSPQYEMEFGSEPDEDGDLAIIIRLRHDANRDKQFLLQHYDIAYFVGYLTLLMLNFCSLYGRWSEYEEAEDYLTDTPIMLQKKKGPKKKHTSKKGDTSLDNSKKSKKSKNNHRADSVKLSATNKENLEDHVVNAHQSKDQTVNEWLLNELDLECPVCMEIPTAVVLQCMRGHLICMTCRKKLNKCPSCREPYQRPMPRNMFVEKLITQAALNENTSAS